MTARPADLRQHLLDTRIAGDVLTTREDNWRNYGRMAQGRPGYDFGLRPARDWSQEEVLEVMARRCGVDPDPARTTGADSIDVELTLGGLDRWRDRLARAAQRRERVLLATGHPTGVLVLHLAVAAALREAGCALLVPRLTWSWPWDSEQEWAVRRPRHVRALAGVHVLAAGGELLHTHYPEPMRAVLDALPEPPDLVVADHGWAGAAAERGIETLGLADSNDPALFVAQEEGRPITVVPLDDNVLPDLYDPVAAHLVSWRRAAPR